MTQPEVPPTSGLVAGKYQLIGMIGRGGMGSVWEASHVSLGTRFAIKFIEAEYTDSVEARSRFDREARAAATIQSKHAIQIYDHGVTEDGKPYIVMELLKGEALDKRIDRAGRMTLQDAARIIQQVSRGLARAHERGIVHRDLKPENIFLVRTPDEDDEVAKVLDFGIAKDLNNTNPGVSSSTKTGAVLGTPFYMSPEQARGLRNVDHRTDVWSLGVIAFKCVTGSLPFDGESVGDLLVKICTAPIPVPSHVAPGLPSSFDAWFMRALEREPDRRFGSVTELADALAFAAGIAVRGGAASSQGQPPLSALSTVASGQAGHGGPNGGVNTAPGANNYPYPVATAPGGTPPSYMAAGGYAQTPHAQTPHAQTPQPSGMTAAPFTASTQPPPTSAGWKVAVGFLGAGALVAGGILAFVVLRREPSATNGAGLAPPPPAVTNVAASVSAAPHPAQATPETTTHAPAPDDAGAANGTKPTPVAVKPATAPQPVNVKPNPAPPGPGLTAPAAKPVPEKQVTPPPVVAPATPPPPLPTPPLPAKKPTSPKDPGY